MAAENKPSRLELGDLYLIETGNDVVDKIGELKKLQAKKDVSDYTKEQIAWEILSLSRRLNDAKLDVMKTRAEGELSVLESKDSLDASERVLRDILKRFLSDIATLKKGMEISRKHADKAAWYNAFTAMEWLAKDPEIPSKAQTVAEATAAREALREDVSKGSDATPGKPSAEKERAKKESYNVLKMKEFASRIDGVLKTLNSGGADEKALAKLLIDAQKDPTSENVTKLQEAMTNKGWKEMVVSKKGDPDGKFGPLTMGSLERIEAEVKKEAKSDTTKADASKNVKETEKGKPKEKNGAFEFGNGSSAVEIRFENGRTWIIGKDGQRVEMKTSTALSDSQKSFEAISENAKKLSGIVDDAFVMLSALADHSVANKWKNSPAFSKRVGDFGTFLSTLDVENLSSAKAKIVHFVHESVGEGDMQKEFQEVFNANDSDTERRKKVYEYVRGSLWPNRRNAGFDGAGASLSKKLAESELKKLDITSKDIATFVESLVDTDLRNKSPAEVASSIFQKRGTSEFYGLIASVFWSEKALVSFIQEIRESDVALKKAYETKEVDAIYSSLKKPDWKPYTQAEIASLKLESRKAKLVEFISAAALIAHVKGNPDKRKGNYELDTFADIEGIGTFDLSDKTKKYVRNELWKDVAIEAAAIGLGALTAWGGAIAIHALAATRWGSRAGEALRMGNRFHVNGVPLNGIEMNAAGRIFTGAVGGGVGFEVGHGAVRTAAASYKNGEFTSAYSWESLAQSMVFGGAFSAAGEVLRRFNIVLDPTKSMSQQKVVLAKQIGADSLAALGVSYGISAWSGERWTAEEALQAVFMAAAFRVTMNRLSGVTFRARRDPNSWAPIVEVSSIAPQQARKEAAEALLANRAEVHDLKLKVLPQIRERLKDTNLSANERKRLENEIFESETRLTAVKREIDVRRTIKPEKPSRTRPSASVQTPAPQSEVPTTSGITTSTVVPNAPVAREGMTPAVAPRISPEVVAQAERVASEANSMLKGFLDNRWSRRAWDLTSKELPVGGIQTVLTFPANLMRLPAINARKVLEIWVERSKNGGVQLKTKTGADGKPEVALWENSKKSLATALTSSEKPFSQGKLNSLLNLGAVGIVGYLTYMEVRESNPSTPGEIVWEATWRYLKNMNVTLPYEMYEQVFKKEMNLP